MGLFGKYGSREEQIQAAVGDKPQKAVSKPAPKPKAKKKRKAIWEMSDAEYNAYMKNKDRWK